MFTGQEKAIEDDQYDHLSKLTGAIDQVNALKF